MVVVVFPPLLKDKLRHIKIFSLFEQKCIQSGSAKPEGARSLPPMGAQERLGDLVEPKSGDY